MVDTTKNKRSTVPIIFNAGGYGTFVEWCLNYFSGESVVASPFNQSGSSHGFAGHHLMDINGWRSYLQSDQYFKLARLHPKIQETDDIEKNIIEMSSSVDTAIVLYSSAESLLLNLNNKFDKLWDHGWLEHNKSFFLKNLEKWGAKSLDKMEPWEIREFLSFFIVKQHEAESGASIIQNLKSDNIVKIEVRALVGQFESTIKKLLKASNLPCVRDDFDEVYLKWVATQKHVNKDFIVERIINSVLNESYYDWLEDDLTIVDESIIQMRLRDLHHLEIKCYNLNVFPTNTNDLRKLLINV